MPLKIADHSFSTASDSSKDPRRRAAFVAPPPNAHGRAILVLLFHFPSEWEGQMQAVRWGDDAEFDTRVDMSRYGYRQDGSDIYSVNIHFVTNPDGDKRSHFHVRILPGSDFRELPKAMMEADPGEAIKAFAVALQDVPKIAREPIRAPAPESAA